MTELLIGCGHRRDKIIRMDNKNEWTNLVTLDSNSNCNPDKVHNLNVLPYPFDDNQFDEIHGYEVLEHCGKQGDYEFFFGQFNEFGRILKPNGIFCATVPAVTSRWLWGDPSHTRVIAPEQLWFLDKDFYKTLGANASSDFVSYLKYSFKVIGQDIVVDEKDDKSHVFAFVLKVIKDGP